MTYQPKFISPNIEGSGGDSGRDGPRGQVMAADDEVDMEWLGYGEQMQHPKSDDDEAEYEFPELERGEKLRESERAGA